MARQTALKRDPKDAQKNIPTRQENLDVYNQLTERQQARYRTIRANKGGAAALKWMKGLSGKAATGPAQASLQQVTEQGFRGGAEAYGDVLQQYREFDPMTMQQRYEPVYSQEMERARQNVMGQFERRNAEEFERQNIATQQQIAERGLDPNSPAAQAIMKQNTQRQDLMRQEAMSSAEQAASGLQQQMYGQAYQTGNQPFEQWQMIQQPYMTGIGAQYQQQLGAQQQQYAKELAALENKYKLQQMRAMPRGGGGGGGGGMSPYDQYLMQNMAGRYGPQGQEVNPWAGVASGFAQGVGAGISQGLMSKRD